MDTTIARRSEIRDFPFIDSPTQILTYLYLGNYNDYIDGEKLKSIGITHVINVCPERKRVEIPGITYYYVNILDLPTADITSVINRVIPTIDVIRSVNPNAKFMINCAMGMSRSASLVIAYIMYSRTMNFHDSWNYVQSRRYIALPNVGFLLQLYKYETFLRNNRSKAS